MSSDADKTVLWWGRFDPDYSRNRILRQAFSALGWRVIDFRPGISPLGDLEATLKGVQKPDILWLPAFRQRDMAAAAKWARRRELPVIFDPMISAYDKQVFERRKFAEKSRKAIDLRKKERGIFLKADRIIADTAGHAVFFADTFVLDPDKIHVIAVGAEESLFTSAPPAEKPPHEPLEVLFYGSFIGLQAPEIIVEAAKLCDIPLRWTLLGDGPLKAACETAAAGYPTITFEDYLPYEKLPARIQEAGILLGVFGTSDKAARVIPNKVYQALACGRTVITRESTAYPTPKSKGLIEIPAGDPRALADHVQRHALAQNELVACGAAARAYYEQHFSQQTIHGQLASVLEEILGG
ncbi:glycosyltransferase [Sneathiella litorea]|uniref:Glycosyltransferase n=1 Tax=Sneathiella litorea TaxID=2606216 RepID=A0A6L8WCQ4_9PROT|nr:glycosyltransferase [Sneathiella litorea]MZR32172.1 glycosyltransferase [Sneathiella litorea]